MCIGHVGTGAAIIRASAVGIKPVSMELGGKNPAIVFEDADLDVTIAGLTRSVFENTGQVCLGTERVYVQRPIFDAVVQKLAQAARQLKPGRPENDAANFGPLISMEHQRKVLGYYALAKEEGATAVCGGGVPDMPRDLAAGAWIEPTVWTGLAHDSRVVREERRCCLGDADRNAADARSSPRSDS